MTEIIGKMWEEGERLAKDGDIQEALLRFMRAKALLNEESNNHSSSSKKNHKNSPIPRILGQIMAKLNESIEKNVATLDMNPVLALQCGTLQSMAGGRNNLKKKDVKKAYRTMILKYHPDKNQDCDTSRIFTTIQTAYERLMAESETASGSESQTGTAAAREREGSAGGVNSRFSRNRHRTQQQRQYTPMSKPKPKSTAPRNEDYYSFQSGRNNEKKEPVRSGGGGDVYGMSSEQIRRVLRLLAAETAGRRPQQAKERADRELAGCSREELVRRYLNARARALSTGAGETQWQQKLADLARKERRRERQQQQSEQPPPCTSRSTGSTSSPRPRSGATETRRSAEQACQADRHRQERVAHMRRELPLMSITELRRMMNTCSVSLTGCVEKADLLRALCKYYGISYDSISSHSPSADGVKSSHDQGGSCTGKKSAATGDSTTKMNLNLKMTSNSLRQVMKSSGYTGFRNDNNDNANSASSHQKASSTPPPRAAATGTTKKETDATSGGGNNDNNSSKVWTRERLKEMEKKLNGDRRERQEAARERKKKMSTALDQDKGHTTESESIGAAAGSSLGSSRGHEDRTRGSGLDSEPIMTVEKEHRHNSNSSSGQQQQQGPGMSSEVPDDGENVISPRGRFLEADEDSDIDDGSASSQSGGESEGESGSSCSDEDEIPWRQFIHHPSAAASEAKKSTTASRQRPQDGHGPQSKQSSSRKSEDDDDDMEVVIPSLDELMRSLGDFDFDLGSLGGHAGLEGDGSTVKKESEIQQRSSKQRWTQSQQSAPPPYSPSAPSGFSLSGNYSPRISPKELRAARLQNIMHQTTRVSASTGAPEPAAAASSRVQWGVSMLADSSGEDDEDEDDEKEKEKEELCAQQHRRASEHRNGYNDSYWRGLILHGTEGRNDTLLYQDGDGKTARPLPSPQPSDRCRQAGGSGSRVGGRQHHQQLHSSFFVKSTPGGGDGHANTESGLGLFAGDTVGSPQTSAWR